MMQNNSPDNTTSGRRPIPLTEFNQAVKDGEISKKDSERAHIALEVGAFGKAVKNGKITDILLHGSAKGFILHGKLTLEIDGKTTVKPCVLITKAGEPRKLKNPQSAFQTIHDMGIRSFKIDIRDWDQGSFYNRHKASVSSRALKQKLAMINAGESVEPDVVSGITRPEMLENRGLYIKKYIEMCRPNSQIMVEEKRKSLPWQKIAENLVKHAIEAKYLPAGGRTTIMTRTLKSWTVEKKVPSWACKAAMDMVTKMGIYPDANEPIELAVFASLWFDTCGPFLEKGTDGESAPSLRAAMASLPRSNQFPKTSIRPHMQAEVNWYKIVLAKREKNKSVANKKKLN